MRNQRPESGGAVSYGSKGEAARFFEYRGGAPVLLSGEEGGRYCPRVTAVVLSTAALVVVTGPLLSAGAARGVPVLIQTGIREGGRRTKFES